MKTEKEINILFMDVGTKQVIFFAKKGQIISGLFEIKEASNKLFKGFQKNLRNGEEFSGVKLEQYCNPFFCDLADNNNIKRKICIGHCVDNISETKEEYILKLSNEKLKAFGLNANDVINTLSKPNTLFSRDFFIKEPSGSSSIQGEDKDGNYRTS